MQLIRSTKILITLIFISRNCICFLQRCLLFFIFSIFPCSYFQPTLLFLKHIKHGSFVTGNWQFIYLQSLQFFLLFVLIYHIIYQNSMRPVIEVNSFKEHLHLFSQVFGNVTSPGPLETTGLYIWGFLGHFANENWPRSSESRHSFNTVV